MSILGSTTLLGFLNQTDQILQFFDSMPRITFIALIPIRGKLLKPDANILLRSVIPLGIGLQTQINTHLRIFLFAHSRLRGCTSTILLIICYRFRQLRRGMQLVVKGFNIATPKEGITTNTAMRLDTPLFDPLLKRHTVNPQPTRSLPSIDKGKTSATRFTYHDFSLF